MQLSWILWLWISHRDHLRKLKSSCQLCLKHLETWLVVERLLHYNGCWQDSVPCRLLEWEPQFLTDCGLDVTFGSLPCRCLIGNSQHNLHHQRKQVRRAREPAGKTEVTNFYNIISKWYLIAFVHSSYQKKKSLDPHKRVWLPGCGDHWELFQKLPTTWSYYY